MSTIQTKRKTAQGWSVQVAPRVATLDGRLTSEGASPSPVILNGRLESLPVSKPRCVGVGGDESHDGECSLVGRQELGRVRKVGEDKDGCDGDDAGGESLDDEQLRSKRRKVRPRSCVLKWAGEQVY